MVHAAHDLKREGPVTVLVLGSGISGAVSEATLLADKVLAGDLPAFAEYDVELWAAAIAQIAAEGEAHTILMGASRSGRECSPRVAVKLDAALIEDAISLTDVGGSLKADHTHF